MTRARRFLAAVALSPVLLSGCTDWAGYDLDYAWGYIPALASMRSSVGFDPYENPLLPPEHSVPLGDRYGTLPASFGPTQLDSAAATLVSPYSGAVPAEVLQRGESLYAVQCAVCHGPTGAGNGTVIGPGKFPFALPVNSGLAVTRSDGYLYAISVSGRGLMPPYGEKLTHMDRWAVVAYIRELQRAGGAAPVAAVPAATPGAAAVAPAAGAAPVTGAADTAAGAEP